MTKIIGINGFKRSGKGETGAAIAAVAADYARSATTLGFADKLKILAAKSLGFVDRSDEECIALMDQCKERWIFDIAKDNAHRHVPWHTLTGREYLQHMGTQARKVFGADFWVDQVLPVPHQPVAAAAEPYISARLRDSVAVRRLYGTDYVAFTDLRFENEAERILALGGEVWEVLRPGTESDGHESEQVLPRRLITRQIDNSGALMDLRYNVEKALSL